MATTTASRRQRRAAATRAPAFPNLALGIQNGLRRLVSDNAKTVAQMVNDANTTNNASSNVNVNELCEKCAIVMKQQQMSPSTFLASFFDTTLLSTHAVDVLQKSGKGSAAVLAERIASEWLKNKMTTTTTMPLPVTEKSQTQKVDTALNGRKREAEVVSAKQVPKKKKTATSSSSSAAAASAAAVVSAAQPAKKKKKIKTAKKKPLCFAFEASLPDSGDIHAHSVHATSKKAAEAAWDFCAKYGLDMPSSDWYTETTRYGEQECYNVMVPAGKKGDDDDDDWEPRQVFVKYMSSHAQRNGEVELHQGINNESFIKIYKKDEDDEE